MKRLWLFLKKICSELLILPIRLYQKCISPLIPPRCRFSPTCSCYAVTALRRFGPIRGSPAATAGDGQPFSHYNGNGGPSI